MCTFVVLCSVMVRFLFGWDHGVFREPERGCAANGRTGKPLQEAAVNQY